MESGDAPKTSLRNGESEFVEWEASVPSNALDREGKDRSARALAASANTRGTGGRFPRGSDAFLGPNDTLLSTTGDAEIARRREVAAKLG